MLRTIISAADEQKTPVFLHFNSPPKQEDIKQNAKNLDLNKMMQNVEGEQFDYGTFKAAYDTDARVKTMTNNFNEIGIEPKTANTIDNDTEKNDDTDKVGQMAQNATDLSDNLT